MAALNHEFFLFDLFHLVTWDDLDLYYSHKAQEMILTDVSDTIHADYTFLQCESAYEQLDSA